MKRIDVFSIEQHEKLNMMLEQMGLHLEENASIQKVIDATVEVMLADPKVLASAMGRIKTADKAKAARANGAKGGRPKGSKDSYKRVRSKLQDLKS